MIEFNGALTGSAKKHLWNTSRKIVRNAACGAVLFLSPLPIAGAIYTKNWWIGAIVATMFIVVFLAPYIPLGKKHVTDYTTNRIYTEDDEYIIALAPKFEESALIKDVKTVIDYGEFYYLILPMGQQSTSFICQKNLISKGTLEEFEALFEGKIQRRILKK